ncbi:MAG: 4-amino-4-deoxychorismate lyase [Epsilonproteobacteria bacterium]|nr:4-amino-4-deoxychorismate lyase [Campylobacterota bacterium]
MFIETLLITDKIQNLALHNKRLNKTRKHFYNAKYINLKDHLQVIPNTRVRVTYDKHIRHVEYFPLQQRYFQTFTLAHSNIIYDFKYQNRDELNALKSKNADEVIIIKNGLVTDTTISNIAFFDNTQWITPKQPLLKGTKREELINKGLLIKRDIPYTQIHKYSKLALINAILGFYIIEHPIILNR